MNEGERWEHPNLGCSEDPRYSDATWPPGPLIVAFFVIIIVLALVTR